MAVMPWQGVAAASIPSNVLSPQRARGLFDDQPVRPHLLRRDRGVEPDRHGAADAQPVGRDRRAQRSDAGLLSPARRGRPDRRRGDRHHAGGTGNDQRARHLDRRAGRGLATDHRDGARRRRTHRPAAVAHGSAGALRLPRRRGAGVLLEPPRAGRHPDLSQRGQADRLQRSSPARDSGNPAPRRRVRRGGGQRDARRLRRRRDPRRERLSDRPVSSRQHQRPHRRLWRPDRKPHPPDDRGGRRRDRRGRRRPYRHPAVAQRRFAGRRRQRSPGTVHRRSRRARCAPPRLSSPARTAALRHLRIERRADRLPRHSQGLPRSADPQRRL